MATQTMRPEARPSMRQRLATGVNKAESLIVRKAVVEPAAWIMSAPASRWAENIGNAQTVEYSPDVHNNAIDAAKDNCVLMVISNHCSDQEVIEEAAPITNIVELMNQYLPEESQIEDLIMPTANSLRDGTQRVGERIIFHGLTPRFLKRHFIRPVFTSTTNDHNERGMDTNNAEYLKTLKSLLKTEHHGIFIYPEGSIRGGKINPATGERYGMQRFRKNSITNYISMIKKYTGREVFIVNLSTEGAWDVFDHTNSRAPIKIVTTGLRGSGIPQVVRTFVGSGWRTDKEPLASLIAQDEQMDKNEQGRIVEDFCGTGVATNLSPIQQGFYAAAA